MRLAGPYLFIFVGFAIGAATTYLFSNNPLRLLPNFVLGVLGSFFGLFIRDIFDISAGGKMGGALVAAALGALLLTVAGNLIYNIRMNR